MYAKEEIRHWTKVNGDSAHTKKRVPRPKQWNLPKIFEWLEKNPIEDSIDIAFLKDVIDERKAIADATEKQESKDNARLSAGNWNSTV